MAWKLADAKNRFSEVFRLCLSDGPQRVERRAEAAYLVSEADYLALTGNKPSLAEFLGQGPDWEDVPLERSQEKLRDLDL